MPAKRRRRRTSRFPYVGDLNTTVLQAIKAELQAGFAGLNSRLDQLIDNVEQKLGPR